MMIAFIIAFGLVIFLMGAVVLFDPDSVFITLNKRRNELSVFVIAIAIRLVLGVLLVLKAGQSSFPLSISVIGWLSIITAVFLCVIGHGHFIRLISWTLKLLAPHARFAGFFAIGFGGFLLYAFV